MFSMQDLHEKWPHRWLSPKAKSFNSEIEGLGVIAVSDIMKGEPVGVLGGVIVPKDEVEDYWKKMTHVGIQIDEDFFIVPTSRKELEEKGVFNHSCAPNCGFRSSITLVAMRDIQKGEELTFDYAFCESMKEGFKCNCKSENCRKKIKSDDWKKKEVQEKYGEYYSPYLKNKIGIKKPNL